MLFLYHCGSTTPVTKHLLYHSAHVYTRTTAHKSEWESFLFFINPPTPYHQNITLEAQGQRRTKRTKVPLAPCGDITGVNPVSSHSVPGINPCSFPEVPALAPSLQAEPQRPTGTARGGAWIPARHGGDATGCGCWAACSPRPRAGRSLQS